MKKTGRANMTTDTEVSPDRARVPVPSPAQTPGHVKVRGVLCGMSPSSPLLRASCSGRFPLL